MRVDGVLIEVPSRSLSTLTPMPAAAQGLAALARTCSTGSFAPVSRSGRYSITVLTVRLPSPERDVPPLGATLTPGRRVGFGRRYLMAAYKIGYFVGSLSSASINRVLAKALIRLAPDELEFTEIPIRDLPLYSQDYDADYPAPARELKQAIEASDGILFVSPE
jgi:hypothetical protein